MPILLTGCKKIFVANMFFCSWSDYLRGKHLGYTPDHTRIGKETDEKTLLFMWIHRKQRGIEHAEKLFHERINISYGRKELCVCYPQIS